MEAGRTNADRWRENKRPKANAFGLLCWVEPDASGEVAKYVPRDVPRPSRYCPISRGKARPLQGTATSLRLTI